MHASSIFFLIARVTLGVSVFLFQLSTMHYKNIKKATDLFCDLLIAYPLLCFVVFIIHYAQVLNYFCCAK